MCNAVEIKNEPSMTEVVNDGSRKGYSWRERKTETVMAVDRIPATRSAMGPANRMPSTPKNMGRIMTKGTKQKMSRTVEETMECTGRPQNCRKMEVIFWKQLKITSERKMRKVFSAKIQ